jgi:hypothetical protein
MTGRDVVHRGCSAFGSRGASRGPPRCRQRVLYRDGHRVSDPAVEESGGIAPEDGVVWFGLYEPDTALLETVQQQFGLHDLIVEEQGKGINALKKKPTTMYYLSYCGRPNSLCRRSNMAKHTRSSGKALLSRSDMHLGFLCRRKTPLQTHPRTFHFGGAIVYFNVSDNYLPIVVVKTTDELETIEDDIFEGWLQPKRSNAAPSAFWTPEDAALGVTDDR